MPKDKGEIAYDENVKKFLSQKIILAHILVNAVKEFKGYEAEKVVSMIEGNPEISSVEVHPKFSCINDMITGTNTEDASYQEGKIYYDVKFEVFVPFKNETIKLIIDVEAQNKYNPGYDIVTRGIYYCARMISAQKGTEFTKSDYDNVKKVYSIWICMNCPKEIQNTITEYSIVKNNIVGCVTDDGTYDLLSVIIIGLSDEVVEQSEEHRLHRLLETFFTNDLTKSEKWSIIQSEYNITDPEIMERRVTEMCNVSQWAIEKGMEKGFSQGLSQGTSQGEDLFASLASKLLEAGRSDDISKAASDKDYREKLYKEFSLK